MDSTEDRFFLPVSLDKPNDSLADLEHMGELLSFAVETAKELAKQMRSGLKSVTPFDGKANGISIDPCKYCDMHFVCMNDIKQTEDEAEQ